MKCIFREVENKARKKNKENFTSNGEEIDSLSK